MYHSLTTKELTVLQEILFAAVEEAYRVVNLKEGDPDWFKCYHPMHRDLGYLFIEAGEELLARLDQDVRPPNRPVPVLAGDVLSRAS